MKYVKHVGKTKNIGRRIIVITPRIPGKEDHALIVDTDSLRDAYLNSLMDAVESPEAQAADDLGTALLRLPSPETGVTWLVSLHKENLMFPEPIDNIIMVPSAGNPIDLKYVIQLMEGKDYDEVMKDKEESYNSLHSLPEVMRSQDIADKEVTALNLITEANRFKLEAERKLEQAYKLAPQLRVSIDDVRKNEYEEGEINEPSNVEDGVIEDANEEIIEIKPKFNDDYFMKNLEIEEVKPKVEVVKEKVTRKSPARKSRGRPKK